MFGVHLLILQCKLQFSEPIKSSAFHIFLNLISPQPSNSRYSGHQGNLNLRQKYFIPPVQNQAPKYFAGSRKTLVNILSRGKKREPLTTPSFETQLLRKVKTQSRVWTKRDQILQCIRSFAFIGSSCSLKQPIMVNPAGSEFTLPKLWA